MDQERPTVSFRHTASRFALELLRVIVTSVRTSGDNTRTSNVVRGGVMNYRVDAFDDGTDPAGWYDLD